MELLHNLFHFAVDEPPVSGAPCKVGPTIRHNQRTILQRQQSVTPIAEQVQAWLTSSLLSHQVERRDPFCRIAVCNPADQVLALRSCWNRQLHVFLHVRQ